MSIRGKKKRVLAHEYTRIYTNPPGLTPMKPLQPEEFSANDHAQESVAYIAWEPSKGEIDGTQFAVAKTHDLIHTAQQIDFEQNFTLAPNFLASMQTCDGGDTANLRYTEKSAQGLKMNVAEEQSLDDEIRHTTEDVGFIALNSQTKEVVYAVNCGGDAYIDSAGVEYSADENLLYGIKSGTSSEIEGTDEDPVFQKLRYGDFYYDIPLENGDYEITLQFVENWWSDADRRFFDVIAEKNEVVTDLDIYKSVGKKTAHQVTVPVTVSDGEHNLEFMTDKDNASVVGIVASIP